MALSVINAVLVIVTSFAAYALISAKTTAGNNPNQSGTSNNVSVSTPSPTPTDTPTPSPTSPPTSGLVWHNLLNGDGGSLNYKGYTAYSGYYYVVVTITFTNVSSQTQVLRGNMLDLQDSLGAHYPEVGIDSQQVYDVNPEWYVRSTFGFYAPVTACTFKLTFFDPSGATPYLLVRLSGSYCRT